MTTLRAFAREVATAATAIGVTGAMATMAALVALAGWAFSPFADGTRRSAGPMTGR